MSVWILHQELTADEEARILERVHLVLPFDNLPDLSMIKNEGECRRLMQGLHPDDPPETIARKTERIWPLYSGMAKEDIIVVPLGARNEVALAEVSGKYQYQVGERGIDIHLIPVIWQPKCFPMRSFGKFAERFTQPGAKLREVSNAPFRTAIRDKFPHGYNRFARWKWLIVGLMGVMGIIRLLERVPHLIHM